VTDKKYIWGSFVLMAIAITLIAAGVFQAEFYTYFVWRSLLLNTLFLTLISLFGTLFYSIHKLANTKWIVTLKPLMLSLGKVFVFLLLMYLILMLNLNQNFSWIANGSEKEWYLNLPFFILRNIIILGGLAFFTWFIYRNESYTKKTYPALFVVFLGVSVLFFAYDWIVSLDPKWHSTVFGWYLLSGLLVTGLSFVIVFIRVFGKRLNLNIEDKIYLYFARYLFAFTLFWAYLWYVQYLLVWYVNKPVESDFYVTKIEQFPILFYGGFITGFVFPFILLISNFARKNKTIIFVAAISGLVGQWCDKAFYILPDPNKGKLSLMLIAVGMLIALLVIFIGLVKIAYNKLNENL
jgi:hypothetical protein